MAVTSNPAGLSARHYLWALPRLATLGCGVALFLFLLLGLLLLTPRFNLVDDAHYILCAQALATGQGYRDIHLPMQPLHRLFPPGMAAFLALPTWLALQLGLSFDHSIIIYKLLLLGCGLLSLYGLVLWAQNHRYSPHQITTGLLLMATSITLLGHTYRVASEIPYILLTILVLLALPRYFSATPLFSCWLPIVAIFLGALFLTRTVAIALWGAIICQTLFHRQFLRTQLLFFITGLLLLPWFWYTTEASPGMQRYWGDMWLQYQINDATAANNLVLAIVRQIGQNAWLMFDQEIPRMIFSLSASQIVREHFWLNAVCLPLRGAISIIILGVIIKNCANPLPGVQLVSFYVLIYSAIILIWPWEPSRFLLPLLPFYCLAFVVGLENLFTRLNLHNIRRQLLITVVTICLLAQFVSVGRLIITVRQTVDYTPATALVWNDLMEAYQWLRTKTNTSSILACAPTIEAHTFLYTQRQAVPLPAKLELLYKTQADYIIKVQDITFNGKTGLQQSEIDFRRLIRKFPQPDFLQIVHRNENVVIYKIDRAKIAQLLGGSLP